MTSHEPAKKLLTPTTTITTPVVAAPRPLMNAPRCQPGSWRRSQRIIIPVCDRVKAMNTPSV